MAHAQLVDQYEHRFTQLREVIEQRERETLMKAHDMGLVLEDQ